MAIYFPVLRWKQGERCALANLSPTVKQQVSPIIEFPINCDYTDRKVADFCENAASDWGTDQAFYLDLSAIDFTSAPAEEEHPALSLLQATCDEGLQIIPVINPNMDPDLFAAIQQAQGECFFQSIAMRTNENDDDLLLVEANDMIRTLGVPRENTDLILDLTDISSGAVQAKMRVLNALVSHFGTNFRNTIVLSGSMPGNLQDYVGTEEEAELPRNDWQLWHRARSHPNTSHVLFGDYTTIPCEFREVPYQGAPKIKYTLENNWYIIKGYRPRGRDNQRQQQSQRIASSAFYRGPDYSFGDRRIHECANGNWGPGNPTNWVTNDVNQHITYVVSQVSAAIDAI